MRVDEVSTLKLESQKLQARTFDGSTQPHCKHVLVTGDFCAADASTPVRSDIARIALLAKMQGGIAREKRRKRHHFCNFLGADGSWRVEIEVDRKEQRRQGAGATEVEIWLSDGGVGW
jgi:hypothetical protein